MENGERLPFSYNYLSEDRYSSYCFINQKEIFIRDVDTESYKYTRQVLDVKIGGETESVIYLPLITKTNPIGVITVQSFIKNAYSTYHLSVLKIIAAYVATALENARAYKLIETQKEEIEKKNQNLESEVEKRTSEIILQKEELEAQRDEIQRAYRNIKLLSDIGRVITSCLTIEDIISKVYENVNALMDASTLDIGIYNEDENRIDFPGTIENGKKLPFNSNPVNGNTLSAWCFKNQKEIFIGDFETEQTKYMASSEVRVGGSTNSIIYLSLNIRDRKLGVLTVQSFRLYAYSNYHLTLMRNLASYIAIAIENAEAYKKLNFTVETLKNTQAQLVQSEKMASLGELTAGIAHEIQNPLNFVNNFSEVNNELIEELKSEKSKLKSEEQDELLDDIFKNNEKINHHGKRADAIVKGMLQHSRSSTGAKESTDINVLCDEYLRLAYHGLKAKDKDFNATMHKDFDETIGKVNIIPQDIGRVLLNLFNNAFYAVSKLTNSLKGEQYKPLVSVTTRKITPLQGSGAAVEIIVSDNGNGIPQNIVDKIFQPFFTTKPTGQGTGLGLSLSYDIIKAHGGEIKVESKEGEGTKFIINLPLNN